MKQTLKNLHRVATTKEIIHYHKHETDTKKPAQIRYH